MKRLISFIVCFCCLFIFAGCGFSQLDKIINNLKDDNSYNDSKGVATEIFWKDTFTFNNVDITINNYKFSRYALGGSYEAQSGKTWLIIDAKLYNNTAKTISLTFLTDSIALIKDDNEARYSSQFFYNSHWINAYSEIEPFQIIEGVFMYSLPSNIVEEFQSQSEPKNIFLELRIKENKISNNDYFFLKF